MQCLQLFLNSTAEQMEFFAVTLEFHNSQSQTHLAFAMRTSVLVMWDRHLWKHVKLQWTKRANYISEIWKNSDLVRDWFLLGDQGGFYHKLLQSVCERASAYSSNITYKCRGFLALLKAACFYFRWSYKFLTLSFYCQVVEKDMEITCESVCYTNYGCTNPLEKFSMAWSQPYSTSHEY